MMAKVFEGITTPLDLTDANWIPHWKKNKSKDEEKSAVASTSENIATKVHFFSRTHVVGADDGEAKVVESCERIP